LEWESSDWEWEAMGILFLEKFPHNLVHVIMSNLLKFNFVCISVCSSTTKCTCILIMFHFMHVGLLTLFLACIRLVSGTGFTGTEIE